MATERRACRRARARTLPPGSHARRPLLLALTVAGALGACRQTVILDPSANGDGGAPTGTAGVGGGLLDAGFDLLGGLHFDGGRFDAFGNLCNGSPIQVLQAVPRTPDLIVSVDRSTSMQAWWGAQTRLEAVQEQLHALVQQYDKAIHFGYEEFPSSTSNMCSSGPGCCSGRVIPPEQMSRNQIDSLQHTCDNGGSACSVNQRPTADALSKINKTFMSLGTMKPGHRRYVILVLGGDPTCSEQSGAVNLMAACVDAVTEVQKLNAIGVFTTVFGVGDEAATATCLRELVGAGGLETSVHLVQTPSALSDSLTNTVSTMAQESCHLDVLTPPVDTQPVSLFINDTMVPNNAADGWDFDAGTTLKITVHGHWCDTLLHTQNFDLVSGCVPPRR